MAAECLEKILAAQGLDRAPEQRDGNTPSGILFVCSAFLCPSASRASSRQNRFGDCAESSGQCGSQPSAGKLSKHIAATTSPSLAESLASPIQNVVSHETAVSNNVRVIPISKTMPHPGNRMVVVPLAFHPLPCQSASSGRNWACPSSSTSRAKRSPSP